MWGHQIIMIVAGILCGSILFSSYLPRLIKKVDIVQLSSDHNPGTANVMKYAGIPLGLLCLVLDVGKGYLPVLWAVSVVEPVRLLFAGVMIAPILGHAYPFWRAGRGGKAIAVSFGVLLGVLRYSKSVWLLAAIYLFFSLVFVIRPNERRSVYTFGIFGAVSAAFLFFGGLPGICVGNMLIAGVVVRRNWADARLGQRAEDRLGQRTEENWEQERTKDA